MANILNKYGIKEVADVTFYKIDPDTGTHNVPVLYLDTLKVSTIEQTAEEVSANGGKGNPPLIYWDYGKDITVTLEDALFSAKSMAILFGNGDIADASDSNAGHATLKRTVSWTATTASDGSFHVPTTYKGPGGKLYPITNASVYDANGSTVSSYSEGEVYFVTFEETVKESGTIEISANSFPGTYYVTGDTYARSERTGKDEFFQFIIPKAKITSENTITLEAEGDPSVFNLNLHVMRGENGKMMELVKYSLEEPTQGS